MIDMAGKVALVTGGASGMGQIIARRLAGQGAQVAIFDVNEQGLRDTAAEAENITGFHCDISSLEDVEAKVAAVASSLGSIDLLVHCAALMPSHQLIDHSHEAMEKLFRINYFGTTYMVRAVLPAMLQRGSGRIIAFGSIAGIALVPKMGAYCATKAAFSTYLESLRCESADEPLTVTELAPGYIDTELNRSLASRPFVISAEKGTRIMADLIEKQVSFRYVPPWPWTLVAQFIKLLPIAMLRKM